MTNKKNYMIIYTAYLGIHYIVIFVLSCFTSMCYSVIIMNTNLLAIRNSYCSEIVDVAVIIGSESRHHNYFDDCDVVDSFGFYLFPTLITVKRMNE
ncbi:hypothetical protein DERP_000123 [Dermatophagoides pteronyssinus]|uniref:Uncharacterized protein n=1 Tax=Dermatophagoides pteronyssinus TaxID=6956 RepID=A0ABQ8IZ81_DERPT|nr:hypothetical protein DERP_000123 [Dermatophagoides pteronyssinus]